jgi:hypothetical protein
MIDLHHNPALHGAAGARLSSALSSPLSSARAGGLVLLPRTGVLHRPTPAPPPRIPYLEEDAPRLRHRPERTQCAPLCSRDRSMRQGPPTTPRRCRASVAIDHPHRMRVLLVWSGHVNATHRNRSAQRPWVQRLICESKGCPQAVNGVLGSTTCIDGQTSIFSPQARS